MEIFSSIRSRSIKLNSKASTNQISSFSRSSTADYGSLLWTFDPNNHCLSRSLTKLIYHKWMFRVWAITTTLLFLLTPAPIWIFLGYNVVRNVLFSIPYYILLILSFNRDAGGFVIRSTEFWIKIGYAFSYGILLTILYQQVARERLANELPEWLGYMSAICGLIDTPLFMAIVGGMDAIPKMKYKSKSRLAALCAVYFTFLAFYHQLMVPSEEDYIIEVKATGSMVSINSLSSNVTGMLAMFLWKQMIDVVRNKDRCISINYKPYLRWESERKDSELDQSVIPETSTVVIETVSS